MLVGRGLGAAVAARAAVVERSARRLVLVDTFGLVAFAPAPDFAEALDGFFRSEHSTHDRCSRSTAPTSRRCADGWARAGCRSDLQRVERAHTADAGRPGAVDGRVRLPPIPAAELGPDRRAGHADLGAGATCTPLAVAEAAPAGTAGPCT